MKASEFDALFAGTFRHEAMLGQGAFACVHLARQLTPQQPQLTQQPRQPQQPQKAKPADLQGSTTDDSELVVVKVIDGQPENDDLQLRFSRECEALKKLRHPNIVNLRTYGIVEGNPYLVFDYVRGMTLEELLKKEGPRPWKWSVKVALALTEALTHAHERNILHRDIKPGNIFILKNGEPLLLDFGLAKCGIGSQVKTKTGAHSEVNWPSALGGYGLGQNQID